MADGLYAAANTRAQEARQAGLQAKKDEQPANTARSYRSKQQEWRARRDLPPYISLMHSELTRDPLELVL
jgi:hypothetical protein